MAAYNVVSADSHVSEPRNLWTERMSAKWQDKAPHMVRKEDGDWFHCEGLRPFPVALGINAGRKFEDYKPTGMTYEDGRAGGWDPHARIKDQEIDGVEAEVLYPTLCMGMFALQDMEFQKVCFEAYNDWMADYCQPYPQRLAGLALVPLADIDWGIKELKRSAEQGLKGVLINDIGWIAHFLGRMDHAFERYGKMVNCQLKLKPSEYCKRQVYATFMDDAIGVANRDFIGVDNLMWSSDYPHSDSTWPHSQEVIAKDFAGVPEADKRKILVDNAVRLYRLG